MLTVTISVLDRNSVVYEEHYEWLQRHLFEPLDILCLNFHHETGELFSISVKQPVATEQKFEVITIFLWHYMTVYRLEGDVPWK